MKARYLIIAGVVFTIISAGQARIGQAQTVEALAEKSGCLECHNTDKKIIGPAFHDIAAKYKNDARDFDLSLMSVARTSDLPQERKSLVVVAQVGAGLHIRIFDADGEKVVDKAADDKLVDAQELVGLQKRLKGDRIPDGSALSKEQRRQIIASASAIAGYSQAIARETLIEKVKKGGKGNWTRMTGGVPMPPFSKRLSDVEIKRLIDWVLRPAGAVELKVMKMGLGSGTVTSNPPGIDCGSDCDETYGSAVSVTLTATPAAGSTFLRWEGDASGTSNPVTVTMSENRSVRAVFELTAAIPPLGDFTPEGIETYLTANPAVNSPARFVKALSSDFKQNWILMSRSESLQTGTAEFPRLLLPNSDARFVFTIGLETHGSYPGSHPNAVEYMQWDPAQKNFRFHEIVVDAIPAMGPGTPPIFPARARGVSIDDSKCSKCHSTRNVLNRSSFPGTTGLPPRVPPNEVVKSKNKPNWDTYDSWGGMMPLNRDRIYQGSVEAAAFRRMFNLWTWRSNDSVRSIMEQLELQPPDQFLPDGSLDVFNSVPRDHVITRTSGGTYDGHINFAFDTSPPVLVEPPPTGSDSISTNYSFDGRAGTGTPTTVVRDGGSESSFVTLHHSDIPTSDEGRGVRFFDALGGLAGTLNQQRIADELINHRFATGSVPIDIRPIALAISKTGLLRVNTTVTPPRVESNVAGAPLTIAPGFFDARNGMNIDELINDTRARAISIPRRKADIQKINLDRIGDIYLSTAATANGLVQQYGAATSAGTDTSMSRLRQEVFRRPIDLGDPDVTVMGGIYVDRELYNPPNLNRVALYRYFLEPLGVSVDKWSMGVRGRSRTYTFADVFSTYYINVFVPELEASLSSDPPVGFPMFDPTDDTQLIAAINSTLSSLSLPPVDAIPKYTDVQRIFNKSCIECHGGLNYPPYSNYGRSLDLSEDESPPAGSDRLTRAYDRAIARTTSDPATSRLYRRLIVTSEDCPYGMMPCGGPALSKADIETIRRWIVGPPSRPYTHGDPHIKTVDGVTYDFQAAGEFVLLRGQNVEIQARHTAVPTNGPLSPNAYTGLTSCVSVNSAVAVRVGSQRITYQPNLSGEPDPDGLQLRVDGELLKMRAQGIPLASGGRIVPTTAPGGIQIEALGGSVIIVTPGWWDHYQLWYLNIDMRHVRASEGLMGAIAPGNWLPALPDGTLLGSQPADLQQRYDDLYGKFGNAWRVSDATSLFDYAPGTSTKTFTVEGWPGAEPANACVLPQPQGPLAEAPQKRLTLEEAEQVCRDIVDVDRRANTIQDVMVTGERGFAKTNLLVEQILRNAMPTAPVLVFPGDNQKSLGRSVKFDWEKSTDKDGDAITYRHYVWPVDDLPNHNDAVPAAESDSKTVTRAVAELKPGKAYFWKVIAEDGKGGTVESATRRFEID